MSGPFRAEINLATISQASAWADGMSLSGSANATRRISGSTNVTPRHLCSMMLGRATPEWRLPSPPA
jgi:hypothetical protein